MNKSILIIPALLMLFGFSPITASADYGSSPCQPIYGGGDTCATTPQLEINKKVQNPKSTLFVDNLSVSDPRFSASQTVTFKITVKNASTEKLSNLTISDILPNFVDFVSGVGTFDSKTNTLTLKLDKLESNEVRDFYIQAKVKSNNSLPTDQNVTCIVNQSIIEVSGKKSQDNSQFCIEKSVPAPVNPATTKGGLKVFPPTQAQKTPETGPEAIALFGLIPSAIGGMLLRRKSK